MFVSIARSAEVHPLIILGADLPQLLVVHLYVRPPLAVYFVN